MDERQGPYNYKIPAWWNIGIQASHGSLKMGKTSQLSPLEKFPWGGWAFAPDSDTRVLFSDHHDVL